MAKTVKTVLRKSCSVHGCESSHEARGFCKKHYNSAKRHGEIKTKGGNYSTHGMFGTPEYNCWCNMKARCDNPKTKEYKLYGAKGVRYCESWSRFENFFADMGKRPTENHSLDRIDPIGDYEPGNCRWVISFIQANNKTKK